MKKKYGAVLLVVVCVSLAGFGFYYKKSADEFHILMLENYVKKNLVSSTTYKRLNAEVSQSTDMMIVEIKFASQNRAGAMIDSKAAMTLVPVKKYLKKVLPDFDKHKDYMSSLFYADSGFPREGMAVSFLGFASEILNDTQLECLNSSFLTTDNYKYPFTLPTLDEQAPNRFIFERVNFEVFKVRDIKNKWEKYAASAEDGDESGEERQALFEEFMPFYKESINKTCTGEYHCNAQFSTSEQGLTLTVNLTLPNSKYEKIVDSFGTPVKHRLLKDIICPSENDRIWRGPVEKQNFTGTLQNTVLIGTCDEIM